MYRLVTNAGAGGNTAVATTPAQDTTGATLIVLHVATDNGGVEVPTDSRNNIWVAPTPRAASLLRSKIFYCANPTVGPNHTFSSGNVATTFPAICMAAFSGGRRYSTLEASGATRGLINTTPRDALNGTGNDGPSASQATGTIIPARNNELIVTGLAYYDGGFSGISVDSGFTITDHVVFINGANFGCALAYLVQVPATPVNPTWAWSAGGNQRAVNVVSFVAPKKRTIYSIPAASPTPTPPPRPKKSAGIFLPQRWNRQPTTKVGIDWRNPLTRGLFAATTPTQGPVEMVHGWMPVVQGPGLRTQGYSRGLAWQTISESRAGLDYGGHDYGLSNTSDFSGFVIANPANTGIYRPFIEFRTNTNSDAFVVLGADLDFGDNSASGLLQVYKLDHIQLLDYLTRTTGSVIDGNMHAYGSTCPYNTDALLYIDGVAQATTYRGGGGSRGAAPPLSSTGANFAFLNVAGSIAATASTVCGTVLALCWTRALSTDEHMELVRRPWQVFAPMKKRIIYAIPSPTRTVRPIIFTAI